MDLVATEVTEVVEAKSQFSIPVLDLSNPDFAALDKADVLPIDLMSDYWSPEREGEFKKVILAKIDISPVKDMQTGEVLELECAYFLEKTNNEVKQIRNGSKRLVGAIVASNLKPGTPLLITYKGKRSNRTNSYKSDNWSIKPLLINI